MEKSFVDKLGTVLSIIGTIVGIVASIIPDVFDLLLSGKNFYCNKKLGLIPFAGVNPFCLVCVRQNQKTKLCA